LRIEGSGAGRYVLLGGKDREKVPNGSALCEKLSFFNLQSSYFVVTWRKYFYLNGAI